MNYRAIGDSVIVTVPELQKETTRESGLIMIQDDPARKSTVIGTVISVGEGKFDSKTGTQIVPPLKVGDKVVISMATGVELSKTHRMIKVDDIFAVLAE